METFRTKYAYKISLWMVLIPTAIYLLLTPYGYLVFADLYQSQSSVLPLLYYLWNTHILAALVSAVILLLAVPLREFSGALRKNYLDLLSLLLSLSPYLLMVLVKMNCNSFEGCFQDQMTEVYIVDSYVIFILLAFYFSIKYLFFSKKVETQN